jgi:hypothetical protein
VQWVGGCVGGGTRTHTHTRTRTHKGGEVAKFMRTCGWVVAGIRTTASSKPRTQDMEGTWHARRACARRAWWSASSLKGLSPGLLRTIQLRAPAVPVSSAMTSVAARAASRCPTTSCQASTPVREHGILSVCMIACRRVRAGRGGPPRDTHTHTSQRRTIAYGAGDVPPHKPRPRLQCGAQ